VKKILKKILKRLFYSKVKFTRDVYPNYQIGRGTYGKPQIFSWGEGTTLTIGSFCSIAPDVKIYLGGNHRIDWVTTYPFSALWEKAESVKGQSMSKGDVIIGNDVWIGADVTILSGVTIGDGAAVGNSSVVSSNVRPYSVVAGNPAGLIKKRFDDEIVSRLLKIQWWNWDDDRIEQFLPLLLSDNILHFLDATETAKTTTRRNY